MATRKRQSKMNDFNEISNKFLLKDPLNVQEIKPFQSELVKCRTENITLLNNKINEVRNALESLKNEVYSAAAAMEKTDNLKKKMLDTEEKIGNLKQGIKEELVSLLTSETTLAKELQVFVKKMEDWGKPLDPQLLKPVKQSSYRIRVPAGHNPVAEFRNFVAASSGHCGGWQVQDHLIFLRERKRRKNKEKFIATLHSLIPGMSCQMIEEHEKWYAKYLELKDKQKEAIMKWKSEKDARQKAGEPQRKEQEPKKESKRQIQHKMNIAERIKEWKSQQLKKRLEEEEKMKKEREKLKEEEERKKQLQEMKKQAVAMYKAEKLSRIQPEPAPEPSFSAKVKNKLLLKAFRLEDMKYAERKRVIRVEIERTKERRKSKERVKVGRGAIEVMLERNPTRIFQPTLNWSHHCLPPDNKGQIIAPPILHLNSIQKLSIPEWRREVK